MVYYLLATLVVRALFPRRQGSWTAILAFMLLLSLTARLQFLLKEHWTWWPMPYRLIRWNPLVPLVFLVGLLRRRVIRLGGTFMLLLATCSNMLLALGLAETLSSMSLRLFPGLSLRKTVPLISGRKANWGTT